MLRFVISITLILSALAIHAQTNLTGSYIATDVRYLSDDELPDYNIHKYSYVKYTFSDPDRVHMSTFYNEKGFAVRFAIQGNRLLFKSEIGTVTNTMRIIESTAEKLVLVDISENNTLPYDPWALKYTFYKEEFLQKKMPLSPDDIYNIKGTDTIYKAGQKIYAQFKEPFLRSYISNQMQKEVRIDSGELSSTFIINENGRPDSVRIIKGINPKINAAYIKAINSTKRMWKPARHNGKNVKVLMSHTLISPSVSAIFTSQKATVAYDNKDYVTALFYLNKALEIRGNEIEDLYRRGICKQILGDLKEACADWTKIQLMGHKMADKLLLKYCK